ncbi:MAG: CopG family transcriptional regulator [Candidatus Bipolaricaulia bacterium]
MKVSEKRTQVYFPEDLHTELKAYAEHYDRSMAEVIREAVKAYLSEHTVTEADWENDPLNQIVGFAGKGAGEESGSVDHDQIIYSYKDEVN